MELGQNRLVPSPEDVAWADSCFSKDPDISDSDWDSLKYSLLETLDTQNSHHSSYERQNFPERESNMEISSSEDDSDVEEPKIDDRLKHESTDDFWSRHKKEDVFLPTYNENTRDFGVFDPEVDFVFQAFELELSDRDIFKTWDLDIAPEEDELIKSLAWKELPDDSLDDLISGIAGLDLSSKSG